MRTNVGSINIKAMFFSWSGGTASNEKLALRLQHVSSTSLTLKSLSCDPSFPYVDPAAKLDNSHGAVNYCRTASTCMITFFQTPCTLCLTVPAHIWPTSTIAILLHSKPLALPLLGQHLLGNCRNHQPTNIRG